MKNHRFLFLLILPFLVACGETTTTAVIDTAPARDSLTTINELIRKDPNNLDLYHRRAVYYMEKQDFSSALLDINRVLQLDSSNTKYLMTGADIHFFINKIQRADQLLKRAVELEPDNIDCLLRLAQLHHYLKRYEEEVVLLNKVLDLDKRNAQAYFMKGMVSKELGDTAQAMQSMQLAVQMDPDYYSAYIQMGVIAAAQKNPLAVEYYRNALAIQPMSEEALYNLGMYYHKTGQYQMALNTYRAILQLDPMDFDAHFNIGAIYTDNLDSAAKGMENFELAIRDNPMDARGYFGRGKAQEAMGNYDAASADYTKALELNPQYTSAALALERMSTEAGNKK